MTRRAGDVESRPYKPFKSEELENLALSESGNVPVLLQITEELRHRRDHQAANDVRDLVARLLRAAEQGQPPANRDCGSDGQANPHRGDASQQGSPAAPPTSPPLGTSPLMRHDYKSRYEVLRETFTAESELLARWGMTSLMPTTLREEVFTFWSRLLSQGQHPAGLTLADLENDLTTLRNEHGFAGEGPLE